MLKSGSAAHGRLLSHLTPWLRLSLVVIRESDDLAIDWWPRFSGNNQLPLSDWPLVCDVTFLDGEMLSPTLAWQNPRAM